MPSAKVNPRHHRQPQLDETALGLPDRIPSRDYFPQPAHVLTGEERDNGKDRMTQKMRVTAIAYHPLDAVLEYPETSTSPSQRVAHVFAVDPAAFRNPKLNIQYSLLSKGGTENVKCRLLENDDDEKDGPPSCYKTSTLCLSASENPMKSDLTPFR